jgi:hypothetical protein
VSWHAAAVCRDHHEIAWVPPFPGRGASIQHRANLTAAAAVCALCPVRGACLDEAVLEHHVGIWAGTTESQRRRIRKRWADPDGSLLRALEREAASG